MKEIEGYPRMFAAGNEEESVSTEERAIQVKKHMTDEEWE